MTGGAAQVGNVGITVARRSCTNCRARRTSVPGLKRSSIDDKSGIDLERMMSSPSTPLNACSSGTVTRDSTSSAESPRHGVWISTRGGANSGKTSTGMLGSCAMPKNIIAAAIASTMNRNFRLVPTIQRIMAGALLAQLFFLELELGSVQLCRSDRHDGTAGRWTIRQNRLVSLDVVDGDRMPDDRSGARGWCTPRYRLAVS